MPRPSAALIRTFALGALALAVCAEDAPPPAPADPPAPVAPAPPPKWTGSWVPAAGKLAKETWGPGGIGTLIVAPASGAVVAAVDGIGLWSSDDGGTSWQALGQQEKALATRPCRILVDPDHPDSWWIAAAGSPGIFATSDGGATIRRLGAIDDVSDLDVDFADTKRELMLAGRRGKERGLEKSTHGGSAWGKAGAKLPDKIDPPEHPLIVDAKTWLVATGGELKDHEQGIYRTEDAGATWRRVFSKGAIGPALRLGRTAILWTTADGGVASSKDAGRSWTVPIGPGSAPLVAMPDGWIAGIAASGLQVSNDSGRSWSSLGPELPVRADGLAYAPKLHAFFAWHCGATAAADAIVRMDVPENLATALRPPVHRTVVVWDGDELKGGYGWFSPKEDPNQLLLQEQVARAGIGALKYRAKNRNWTNFGWNWDDKTAPVKIDPATCKSFVCAFRLEGDQKPQTMTLQLGEVSVPLATLCPDAADGAWHDIVAPMSGFGDKLDVSALKHFRFNFGSTGDLDFTLYLDEIGFTDQ